MDNYTSHIQFRQDNNRAHQPNSFMGTLRTFSPTNSKPIAFRKRESHNILLVQTATLFSTTEFLLVVKWSSHVRKLSSWSLEKSREPPRHLLYPRLGSGLLLRDCPSANAPHRRGTPHSAVYTRRISCPQLGSRVHLFMLVVALTPPNRPR